MKENPAPTQDRVLQIPLQKAVGQPQKIQDIRVFEDERRRHVALAAERSASSCRISESGFFESAVRS